jgi:hypothetical protein
MTRHLSFFCILISVLTGITVSTKSAQPRVNSVEVVQANGGTATNAIVNGDINPLNPTYGAIGNDSTDDTTLFVLRSMPPMEVDSFHRER